MQVEVVYALPDQQTVIAVELAEEAIAIEAVEKSGILDLHEELKDKELALGIFSKSCAHDYQLKQGERVEIYRPLLADPKEIRKRRAAEMAAKKAAEAEANKAAKSAS